MKWFNHFVIFLIMVVFSFPSYASDQAKEKRWADQITEFIVVGEPVWLKTSKGEFLGLYTEAEEPVKGAVIILHGIGVHPDWQDVISPLRTRLPEQGWATLSIQMPVLHNEAKVEEYEPLFTEVPDRIRSAVAYLKSEGFEQKMGLVAHSFGTDMGGYYLTTDPDASKRFHSFVAIAMGAPRDEDLKDKQLINRLKNIPVPVLDLYGVEHEHAADGAKHRFEALKSVEGAKQQAVNGAGHFFQGKNDELVKAVIDWLSQVQ